MILQHAFNNWVDLVIILVVILYILEGWKRGLLLGLIDFGGFIFSFIASLKFYSVAGSFIISSFSISKGISYALGFLGVGFLTEIIFSMIVNYAAGKLYPEILKLFKEKNTLTKLSSANKLLGVFPALGEALVIGAFVLTLLITLPIKGSIKKDIVSSRIGGYLVIKTQGIENTLKTIFGQAVNETLTFLTINPSPTSEEKVDLYFTQKEVTVNEQAEETMLSLVNSERVLHGLRHLSLSFELRTLARDYARDMFARGYFSHYDPDGLSPFNRMQKRNITFTAAGENLALAPNAELAYQGLMNSPGHRANILSPDFGKVGIGVIDGGIYGEMFVQEFTN